MLIIYGWKKIKHYSILFYSILFYSILFYSILFYSILFFSILFYSILLYSLLFLFLFYSILFLFYSILFYSILFYSILFYSIPIIFSVVSRSGREQQRSMWNSWSSLWRRKYLKCPASHRGSRQEQIPFLKSYFLTGGFFWIFFLCTVSNIVSSAAPQTPLFRRMQG